MLWVANTIIRRISLEMWYCSPCLRKNLASRSGVTSSMMFSEKTPLPACSMARLSTSVAKIFTSRWTCISSMTSRKRMAMEYASSPVEQPADQTRMGSSSLARSTIL